MKICDLKNKEVINICDGKILGFVGDIDFDINKGTINAIIVPGPIKLFSFCGKDWEYVIPYECVVCIGPDAILVKVKTEEVKVKCS